jgi:hypothetical protein
MQTVSTTQFARNFGRFQDEAHREGVIEITSHGRTVGGYLSAEELARYRRLLKREREVLVVGQLPDDVVAALELAEYDDDPTSNDASGV